MKVAQILLKQGANPNQEDKYHQTPLYWALPLPKSAEKNISLGTGTKFKQTHKDLKMMKLLVKKGALIGQDYQRQDFSFGKDYWVSQMIKGSSIFYVLENIIRPEQMRLFKEEMKWAFRAGLKIDSILNESTIGYRMVHSFLEEIESKQKQK